MASKRFAIIIGAGTGTGRAVALRFAKSYPVAVLARTPKSYQGTVEEINKSGGRAVGIIGDAADAKSMDSAFDFIKKELSGLKLAAAIYNVASSFKVKPFLETSVDDDFDTSYCANTRGLFIFAQKSLPLLLDGVGAGEYPPTMLITGATASVRASAKFSALASSMFARRAIAQSLAREFGPQGVHVAHAIMDGVIDVPRSQGAVVNDGVEDGKLKPDAIAESYWHLHTQHRSAFTQELDMRPYVEKF